MYAIDVSFLSHIYRIRLFSYWHIQCSRTCEMNAFNTNDRILSIIIRFFQAQFLLNSIHSKRKSIICFLDIGLNWTVMQFEPSIFCLISEQMDVPKRNSIRFIIFKANTKHVLYKLFFSLTNTCVIIRKNSPLSIICQNV